MVDGCGRASRPPTSVPATSALPHLVPIVGRFLEDADDDQLDSFWSLLGALDAFVASGPATGGPPANGVLLGALLYDAFAAERAREPGCSASSVAEVLLGSLVVDLGLSRRDYGCCKFACSVQHRFDQDEDKRQLRDERILHSPFFDEALLLFELRTRAVGGDLDLVKSWRSLAGADRHQP